MGALWALLRLRLGPVSVRVWVGHWVIYSLLAGHHGRVDYLMTYPPCDGYLVVWGLLLCIHLVYYICCWCGSWALRPHSLVSAVLRITWPKVLPLILVCLACVLSSAGDVAPWVLYPIHSCLWYWELISWPTTGVTSCVRVFLMYLVCSFPLQRRRSFSAGG